MGDYLPLLPATSEHGGSSSSRSRRGGGFRSLVSDGESPTSREDALKARVTSVPFSHH